MFCEAQKPSGWRQWTPCELQWEQNFVDRIERPPSSNLSSVAMGLSVNTNNAKGSQSLEESGRAKISIPSDLEFRDINNAEDDRLRLTHFLLCLQLYPFSQEFV